MGSRHFSGYVSIHPAQRGREPGARGPEQLGPGQANKPPIRRSVPRVSHRAGGGRPRRGCRQVPDHPRRAPRGRCGRSAAGGSAAAIRKRPCTRGKTRVCASPRRLGTGPGHRPGIERSRAPVGGPEQAVQHLLRLEPVRKGSRLLRASAGDSPRDKGPPERARGFGTNPSRKRWWSRRQVSTHPAQLPTRTPITGRRSS